MEGYLLDTNILRYLHDTDRDEHTKVQDHYLALLDGSPVYVSAITLGEIEYGHRSASKPDVQKQSGFNRFVRDTCPHILPVSKTTREAYGQFRADLFRQFAPKNKKHPRWPEDLMDAVTSKQLGIQENDLWLVAQALERNLVFVTNDRMTHIQQVAPPDLKTENWTQ